MTTTDPKEPSPPSETPSDRRKSKQYDPAEVSENILLRAVEKAKAPPPQPSSKKSPPHLRLVKRP